MEKRDLKKRKEIIKQNKVRTFDYWAEKCKHRELSYPKYIKGEWICKDCEYLK